MTKTTFIDWLKEKLIEMEWSQAEFARRTHLSPAQITRLLNGQRGIGEVGLNAIASAFNIPAEDVFEKAGFLPTRVDMNSLSEEQKQVIHQVTQLDDEKILGMIIAMLDHALKEQASNKRIR